MLKGLIAEVRVPRLCLQSLISFQTLILFYIFQKYIDITLTTNHISCLYFQYIRSFVANLRVASLNPLMANGPNHIEASQWICNGNQLTGFYMMGNIGRWWVTHIFMKFPILTANLFCKNKSILWILSCIILKNDWTYFKNLAVWTLQEF